MEDFVAKPLHETVKYCYVHTELQLNGTDIAIPYVIGAPGGGKSSVIDQYFRSMGYDILCVHFAFTPIEEISGLPQFIKVKYNNQEIEGTRWTLPDLVTLTYDYAGKCEKLLLFMDDFHLCSPAHMEYGYQLFTNKSIRNYKLPDNTAIILAGNYGQKAGAKSIFSGISNRIAFYPVYMDFQYWVVNFANENVHPDIISFLSESSYSKHFHQEERVDEPWASPRAWTRFSSILTTIEKLVKVNYSDLLYLANAHVGREAASDFVSYYKILRKLKISDIFDGKQSIVLPEDELVYTFAIASTVEFLTRYTKAKPAKRDSIVKTYCAILTKVYEKSKESCLAMIRDIVIKSNESKVIEQAYHKIRSSIPPEISSDISKMIMKL